MKGNNGSGNNSLRDGWITPLWIIDPLNKQYKFTVDCCATEENKKAQFFTDDFINWNDILPNKSD